MIFNRLIMKIIEVVNADDKKEFIEFPKRLYKDDPSWICPLDSIVESVFDPGKNHSFRNGEAKRWIVKDNSGLTAGRIAAFIDRTRSNAQSQPTGGIGFFEATENREIAFALFDIAREWLASKGMEAIDGPINFGENDNNWGLLVDGFHPQPYGMPYNKRYYREHFESYGFRNYFEQYSRSRIIRGSDNRIIEFPERIMRISERIASRPGYSFRHFEFRNCNKFIDDICEIYNSTWIYLKEDFTPLDPEILGESLRSARMIIDEELIWFGYHNEKPVGFFVLFPDFNQILRHFKGRLNIPLALWYKFKHEMTRVRALVGGIHYSYQNAGIESAIFYQYYKVLERKKWIKSIEFAWLGDYNPRMMALYDALGAVPRATHVTFRYLINGKLKFVRYRDELTHRK